MIRSQTAVVRVLILFVSSPSIFQDITRILCGCGSMSEFADEFTDAADVDDESDDVTDEDVLLEEGTFRVRLKVLGARTSSEF